jgi:hypothetical protein
VVSFKREASRSVKLSIIMESGVDDKVDSG